jgi:hypothetical protein
MANPTPILVNRHTINQSGLGSRITIENAGADVALPLSTQVLSGWGFDRISDTLQPVGSNRAYEVGPLNFAVRPFRLKSWFIVGNPQEIQSTAATVIQALLSATFLKYHDWYLTLENVKMSEPVFTSYTTFEITFEVRPRFAFWTSTKVTTESAFNSATKSYFITYNGYLKPTPVIVDIPIAWVTGTVLPGATVMVPYAASVFASGGNGAIVYSKVSGYSELEVTPLGLVVWPEPFSIENESITVRASDGTKHEDRTFTIQGSGALYPSFYPGPGIYPI